MLARYALGHELVQGVLNLELVLFVLPMWVSTTGRNDQSGTYRQQQPLPAFRHVARRAIQRRQVRLSRIFVETARSRVHAICRIKKLKTFTEVMGDSGVHKDSVGCEICKPAVGSVLASLWNEHIMNPVHHACVLVHSYSNLRSSILGAI